MRRLPLFPQGVKRDIGVLLIEIARLILRLLRFGVRRPAEEDPSRAGRSDFGELQREAVELGLACRCVCAAVCVIGDGEERDGVILVVEGIGGCKIALVELIAQGCVI